MAELTFVGDFNVDWTKDSQMKQSLVIWMDDIKLHQKVDQITRYI